jgi:hypothetical protein
MREFSSGARGSAAAHGAGMLRASIFVVLAACAVDPSSAPTTGGGGGKADGSEPTITFAADFTNKVSGSLLAGSPVRVRYAVDRLPSCRGESNGQEVWGVTGYALFDDGSQTSFDAKADADVELPASASNVAFYFVVNNVWGCVAYDSNYGNNYGFAIDRHGLGATLDFDAAGNFTQAGAVHEGDQIVVHYAPERLKQCEAESGGYAQWGITLHWQVDGGAVHDASALATDPVITVPRGHDLAMWFEATNVYGCHAYDSANGANYHVAID